MKKIAILMALVVVAGGVDVTAKVKKTRTVTTTTKVTEKVIKTKTKGRSGNIMEGYTDNSLVSGLTNLVVGSVNISERELAGNWRYAAPGCAFTSDNLLAKAGGAVAAEEAKQKLQQAYDQLGVNSDNTQFRFDQAGKFEAKINGVPMKGSYKLESDGTLKLKTLIITHTAYVTRTAKGIAITMESKKILPLIQGAASLTGNKVVKTAGDLSKNFKGMRVGFELKK